MNLATPIEKIPRVGPQYQKKLKKLGIKTVGQLLFHFPHRYEDFSNVRKIAEVNKGEIVSIQGKILEIRNIRTFRKRITLTQAVVGDDSGSIPVIWFNQPYLVNSLKKGDLLFLAGKMNQRSQGRYLSSPAYEKTNSKFEIRNSKFDLIHTGRLVPVYPETEGLSSRWLRAVIRPILTDLNSKIPDALPQKIREDYDLLPFSEAIWQIHFPDTLELAKKSKKRFVFEELLTLSLFVLRERMKLAREKSISIPLNLELVQAFTRGLPFKLTDDQKKASWQILKDMEKQRPMNRLLEGDVGSGKTIVSAIAALNTVKAGFQVAFMAPTEILTKQHYQTFSNLLNRAHKNLCAPVKIGLVTSKENKVSGKKITRKELLEKTKKGKIDILIGTHALVQKEVRFDKLALVIIDEQHRFGVEQRAKLCQQQKEIPHLLSMTATPIPRTLALTIYGDLDLSLIKEMPRGRKKIITEIVAPEKRNQTYNFITQQIKKGRQVFVICPRIEKSEIRNPKSENLSWLEVKTVTEEHEKLSNKIFPQFKIDMLHGRMKNKEKEKIMKNFKNKKTDVLVSTSVVEVGIDIRNATVMMIEGADKFGLAQLHQFRGRVGRGEEQSFCFLLTDFQGQRTNQRLRALIKSENGFDLAEKDLEIRGPGDFSGQRQWGIPDIAMEAMKDISLVEKSREEAKEILKEDPELKKYPSLREKLQEFQKQIHLE